MHASCITAVRFSFCGPAGSRADYRLRPVPPASLPGERQLASFSDRNDSFFLKYENLAFALSQIGRNTGLYKWGDKYSVPPDRVLTVRFLNRNQSKATEIG